MPAPNEIVLGQKWSYWVTAGAKAIIASTDPPLRWLIMREGFQAFQDFAKARQIFDQLTPFSFNSYELRWIFETLCNYATHREGKWHPKFEQRYQEQLHKDIERPSDPNDEPDIVTVEDKFGRVTEFKR